MEGLEFSQIFNAMLASIVFPVVVGILNRIAERGTSKDTKARLELVGESLGVLEKLDAAAKARPGLRPEAERFEAVIAKQCDDLFEDLDARHVAFARRKTSPEFRLLPRPAGVFSYLWWFIALALFCFTALLALLLVYALVDDEADGTAFYVDGGFAIFIVFLFAMLARWAAFVSARWGAADDAQRAA